jgi:polyether ionophore transport system permease protein
LGSPAGLSLRLTRPVIAAWIAGLGLCALLFGVVATSAAQAVSGSDAVEEVIGRLGGERGGAASFLGLTFVILAGFIAFAAAGQIASTRDEERDGYLDHLLSRAVARWRWLAGRLAIGATLAVVAGFVVGLIGWAGAASQDSGIGLGEMIPAGLNIVPPALFVLGVGTLVYGAFPRVAPLVAYGLVAWSFLVEVVASVVESNRLLLNSSLFSHVTPAPAADPDWTAAAWLAGLGLLAALVGIAGFRRRDLVTA